jgi:hypothetical protein
MWGIAALHPTDSLTKDIFMRDIDTSQPERYWFHVRKFSTIFALRHEAVEVYQQAIDDAFSLFPIIFLRGYSLVYNQMVRHFRRFACKILWFGDSLKPTRTLLFFIELAKLIAIAILPMGAAFAAAQDCIGQNKDGSTPGRAICVDPVPTEWVYGLCDIAGAYTIHSRAWCSVEEGTWDPDRGCLGGITLSEENIIPIIDSAR